MRDTGEPKALFLLALSISCMPLIQIVVFFIIKKYFYIIDN